MLPNVAPSMLYPRTQDAETTRDNSSLEEDPEEPYLKTQRTSRNKLNDLPCLCSPFLCVHKRDRHLAKEKIFQEEPNANSK